MSLPTAEGLPYHCAQNLRRHRHRSPLSFENPCLLALEGDNLSISLETRVVALAFENPCLLVLEGENPNISMKTRVADLAFENHCSLMLEGETPSISMETRVAASKT